MKSISILYILLSLSFPLMAQDTLYVQASPAAGFFDDATTVKIQANKSTAAIYYTTDGTRPTSYSKRYRNYISIDSTAVLRAVAYLNGKKSRILTGSYFIKDSISLPVVSVSIQPEVLFDPYKGVFLRGPNASPKFPFNGANFYSRKEFPAQVEIFETDKTSVYNSAIGFKIFGGMSRIFPQKSFSLYASNSRYGNKYIRHRIFPEKKQKKYKRLVMRNSGSDFGETHFRDALITSIGKEMGLEVQAYRPAVVFINGTYWGIYNFREKLTRHYISENFQLHKDSLNLIEHRKSIQAGSRKSYDAMQRFMRDNPLSAQENYDYIATQMDIDNFMEYQIIQIYIDNQDAGGNIKFWRPMKEGGRWRWILFDTDFGLGHYGRYGFKNNSLAFHTRPDGPAWPNPPWSTFNLRSLLKNKGFQAKFVSRFLDRINSTLDSSTIVPKIDAMAAIILPELPRHWERWNLTSKRWQKEVDRMKEYSRKRPAFMREFLHEMFPQFGQDVAFTLKVDSNGLVLLNNVIEVDSQFQGVYFQELPISLRAQPFIGTTFSHWELNGEKIEGKSLDLPLESKTVTLKAIFIKKEHPKTRQVIINEISLNDSLSGDWIELYNDADEAVDLKNWTLRNAGHKIFRFPSVQIPAKGSLVVAKDIDKFEYHFPSCQHYIDGLLFGFGSKKEQLMVFDPEDNPVDSVTYNWMLDSTSFYPMTIALKDHTLDNSQLENWRKHRRSGSPASINPDYLNIKKEREWHQFLRYVQASAVTTAIFVVIVFSYVGIRKKLKKR